LIDFHFFDNKFELSSIEIIKRNLLRNKKNYDEARLQEWKERKLMNGEDMAMYMRKLDLEAKKKQMNLEEESKE
jgi:hypothetical protein